MRECAHRATTNSARPQTESSAPTGPTLNDSPVSCRIFSLCGLSAGALARAEPFPDRHFLFQFLHDPLTRFERSSSVGRADSEKQRRFAGSHKSNAMMKYNLLQLKLFSRRVRDQPHLMFCHRVMAFIFDPFDRS